MKLIDFDGLFDEKLTQFMEENKNKYTEKQWEDIIPKLYKKFGDTFVAKIKCTPKEYYAKMTDSELTKTLIAHIESEPLAKIDYVQAVDAVTMQDVDTICGDTLFAASCGRTDLPGGDYDTIMASLRRIAGLEGNLRCLPGHMSATWLDREREYNPYVRQAMKK